MKKDDKVVFQNEDQDLGIIIKVIKDDFIVKLTTGNYKGLKIKQHKSKFIKAE